MANTYKLDIEQCGSICALNEGDEQCARMYERMGLIEKARETRDAIDERRERCLGSIAVSGDEECGILHGNEREV